MILVATGSRSSWSIPTTFLRRARTRPRRMWICGISIKRCRLMPKGVVAVGKGGIGPDQRRHGSHQQHAAADGLDVQEALECGESSLGKQLGRGQVFGGRSFIHRAYASRVVARPSLNLSLLHADNTRARFRTATGARQPCSGPTTAWWRAASRRQNSAGPAVFNRNPLALRPAHLEPKRAILVELRLAISIEKERQPSDFSHALISVTATLA